MADVATLSALLSLRDEASGKLTAFSGKLDQMGNSLKSAGMKLATLSAPLLGLAGVSVKSAMDFETSFAGILKTVDATEEEFSALAKGMRDMAQEIPVSVNELNRIGEAAGQLGIKTENIMGFTRTIADLAVTTNLTAESASSSLARIANITQLPQSQFDRLGSTVVALGNKFQTTEAEIVEFGLRIAGAGQISGLTQAQILSIGAAMSSVGVEAEAGGTAVQKVLIAMTKAAAEGGDDLKAFGKTAGMSAEQFAQAFRDDAAGAFEAFVRGLGQEGDKAFGTLATLGMEDQRLMRSFISLANAGDLLTRTLGVGTRAWQENTALTIEAQKRYQTFQSQLALTKNKLQDIAITAGQALIPVLLDLLQAVAPIIKRMAEWIEANPTLVKWLAAAGVAMAGMAAVLIPLGMALSGLAPIIAGVGIALGLLLSPIGLVVAAVVGLAAVFTLNLFGIREKTRDALAWVARHFIDAVAMLAPGGVIAVAWRHNLFGFADVVSNVADAVGNVIEIMVNTVIKGVNLLGKAVDKIPGLSGWHIDEVSLDFGAALDKMRAKVNDTVDGIGGSLSDSIKGWSFWADEVEAEVAAPVVESVQRMAEGFTALAPSQDQMNRLAIEAAEMAIQLEAVAAAGVASVDAVTASVDNSHRQFQEGISNSLDVWGDFSDAVTADSTSIGSSLSAIGDSMSSLTSTLIELGRPSGIALKGIAEDAEKLGLSLEQVTSMRAIAGFDQLRAELAKLAEQFEGGTDAIRRMDAAGVSLADQINIMSKNLLGLSPSAAAAIKTFEDLFSVINQRELTGGGTAGLTNDLYNQLLADAATLYNRMSSLEQTLAAVTDIESVLSLNESKALLQEQMDAMVMRISDIIQGIFAMPNLGGMSGWLSGLINALTSLGRGDLAELFFHAVEAGIGEGIDEYLGAIVLDRGAQPMQHGGIVREPTLALIGEHGPEAVIPLSRGGAGSGLTVIFQGPVYGMADFRDTVTRIIRDAAQGGGFDRVFVRG